MWRWNGLERIEIGVIGGTGLYDVPELTDRQAVTVPTPFGSPSDAIVVGSLGGRRVGFLPRHGRAHAIAPSEVNSLANLWALKALGARAVIAFSAVGSLRPTIHPLDVVVPDQLFDRTVGRQRTFFGRGLVAHVGLAEPFCPVVRSALVAAGQATGANVHAGGTYICIEGPQFSTWAESALYRTWGFDVIGMTAVPEARLAREAELPYAVMALVSDYDVWHASEEPVSADLVLRNLAGLVETARRVVVEVTARLDLAALAAAPSANALTGAISADLRTAPPAVVGELWPLLARYLEREP